MGGDGHRAGEQPHERGRGLRLPGRDQGAHGLGEPHRLGAVIPARVEGDELRAHRHEQRVDPRVGRRHPGAPRGDVVLREPAGTALIESVDAPVEAHEEGLHAARREAQQAPDGAVSLGRIGRTAAPGEHPLLDLAQGLGVIGRARGVEHGLLSRAEQRRLRGAQHHGAARAQLRLHARRVGRVDGAADRRFETRLEGDPLSVHGAHLAGPRWAPGSARPAGRLGPRGAAPWQISRYTRGRPPGAAACSGGAMEGKR